MAPPRIYDDINAPLTAEELRRVLSYDRETGVFRWNIDTGRAKPGAIAGTPNGGGYLLIRVKNRLRLAHILAWFYVHGEWPKKSIDHKNTIRSDNWISNLREATKSQNAGNCRRHRRNKSGLKGVIRCRKRWAATISANRTRIHLGVFDTPEQAHAAYVAASAKYFGEFARAS